MKKIHYGYVPIKGQKTRERPIYIDKEGNRFIKVRGNGKMIFKPVKLLLESPNVGYYLYELINNEEVFENGKIIQNGNV